MKMMWLPCKEQLVRYLSYEGFSVQLCKPRGVIFEEHDTGIGRLFPDLHAWAYMIDLKVLQTIV